MIRRLLSFLGVHVHDWTIWHTTHDKIFVITRVVIQQKTCSICGKIKTRSEFS